jgi:OmpA-OmpF porin, OOP family
MKKIAAVSMAALAAALLGAGCASQSKPAESPPPAAAPQPMNLTLAGDALFAFGKSSLADLSAGGRQQLDDLAARLQTTPFGLVRIAGHSDRIGSDSANMALSTRRAEAVRDYLVQQGIPEDRIIATGRGRYQPVAQCESERGQALIDCLAPNRRVEITVDPPFNR